MIIKNIKRIFKNPDKQQQIEKKEELDGMELEKNDIPAMIISAYIVIIPVAVLVLLVFALIAFLFIS